MKKAIPVSISLENALWMAFASSVLTAILVGIFWPNNAYCEPVKVDTPNGSYTLNYERFKG